MVVILPDPVYTGIRVILASKLAILPERYRVMVTAERLHDKVTAEWIRANKELYLRGVVEGFTSVSAAADAAKADAAAALLTAAEKFPDPPDPDAAPGCASGAAVCEGELPDESKEHLWW